MNEFNYNIGDKVKSLTFKPLPDGKYEEIYIIGTIKRIVWEILDSPYYELITDVGCKFYISEDEIVEEL